MEKTIVLTIWEAQSIIRMSQNMDIIILFYWGVQFAQKTLGTWTFL